MADSKFTKKDLDIMQKEWSFEHKIGVTQTRIAEFYEHYEGQVYISFSGGKDSTVLLDIARRIYPDIEAVFCDTGLEYPEIRKFVKQFDNVTWIKPKRSFKEVITTFGYPVISKEVSEAVNSARNNMNAVNALKLFGLHGKESRYNRKSKWCYLVDNAPFKISKNCCNVLKKQPFNKINKTKKPIVGTLAEESALRKTQFFKYGCNSFEGKAASKPMSFWTEQDVLQYIKRFNLPIASVYGKVVEEMTNHKRKTNKLTGKLITTGVSRTGCMFCMFGAHLEKSPNRFERMRETHPDLHEYCLKNVEAGGLGLGKVLDFLAIKY